VAQDGGGQGVAWVKTWFFEVVQDVIERWEADANFFGYFKPGGLFRVITGSSPPISLSGGQGLSGGAVPVVAAKTVLQFE